MSKVSAVTVLSPYLKDDIAAFVEITNKTYFILTPIEVMDRYTISFFIKSDKEQSITVQYGENYKDFQINTEWLKISWSFKTEWKDNLVIKLNEGNYYLFNTQLERGSVATDYNKSPEDVEKDIENIETISLQRYNQVVQSLEQYKVEVGKTYVTNTEHEEDISRLTLNADEFKTEVSKTYTTKTEFEDSVGELNQDISDVDKKTDNISSNISNNYSTTVQMNSAIKESADAINLSVSKTYTTKTEFEETKTQVQLNSTKIDLMVESSEDKSQITLTDKMIKAITTQFVVTNEDGTSTIIEGGTINLEQLFAQDITATGTIRGVNIITNQGEIGGWLLSEYGLGTAVLSAEDFYKRVAYVQPPTMFGHSENGIFSVYKANEVGENPSGFTPIFIVNGNGDLTANSIASSSGANLDEIFQKLKTLEAQVASLTS